MPHQQRNNRVALAIAVYFGSATASLAWILHRARPARARTWSTLVEDAASLWDTVPSELAVFVLLNFFVSALAMAAVITATLFLGRLSVAESQRMSHRLVKYAVFKMVFVGSVITPDPRDIAVWLAWFAVVGYLRVFLGAAKDRLETLLSSPGAQLGRHARGVCLLLLVLLHNAVWFALVLRVMPGRSVAKVLLCAFDSAVVAIEGIKSLLRYAVHMADRYQCVGGDADAAVAASPAAAAADTDALDAGLPAAGGGAAGGGWDVGCWSGKGNFLYHAELVADVLVHAVTLAHYLHVWVLHGLSFHLIDMVLFLDMRAVLLSLLRRLRSHLSYRAATKRLNTTFRDVHPAAADCADCTICMDEIVHVAKQLPCGHVFHLSCLRAWLQQSGSESFTCPNCRKPILVGGPNGDGGAEGGDSGQQRRESSWWLVRTLDRLYVRMVVALEPVLLTLLLSITLWLGGRAQQIRRRAARSPPSPPREGFGESPGPSARTVRGRARGRFADDSDLEEEEIVAAVEAADEDYDDHDEYGSSDGDDDGGGGDRLRRYGYRPREGEGLWDLDEEEEEEEDDGGDDGRDADSDAEDERAAMAGAARQRGWGQDKQEDGEEADGQAGRPRRGGGWRGAARHICSALGAGHGCGGAGCSHHMAAAAGAAPQQTRRSPHAHGAARWGSWHDEPTGAGESMDERYGQRRRDGGASGRGGRGRGVDGAGPSAAAGARRRGAAAAAAAAAAEVPSYSGDVLVPQAAAAAQRIGRTISASLRSTWSAGGRCAGAVAWAGDDSDDGGEEVSSHRRRPRSRATRPQGGAATQGGRSNGARRAPGAGNGGAGGDSGEVRRRLSGWN